MPLQRRLPKFGFNNIFRVEYTGINLDALQKLSEKHGLTEINHTVLCEKGLVSKRDLVKILGRGELKVKVNVTAHAFSATAKSAIETAGGTTTILDKK
jgi:large subunit ribosomal protein L15